MAKRMQRSKQSQKVVHGKRRTRAKHGDGVTLDMGPSNDSIFPSTDLSPQQLIEPLKRGDKSMPPSGPQRAPSLGSGSRD
jgi:hypothetical protein